MSANAGNQESEGLLSPFLRSIRLKKAAALIPPNSVVLDLACGGGYLRRFLPAGCRYYGVDRIQPPQPECFDAFLHGELTAPGFFEELEHWLPRRADVVTLLAFIEHVKAPEQMLAKLKKLLSADGRVILTTPHPAGRKLHDGLARARLCSSAAAAEHEQFFGRADLEGMAQQAGYAVLSYRRFLWGLNQVIEISPQRVSAPPGPVA